MLVFVLKPLPELPRALNTSKSEWKCQPFCGLQHREASYKVFSDNWTSLDNKLSFWCSFELKHPNPLMFSHH